jgi:hypothetical protein
MNRRFAPSVAQSNILRCEGKHIFGGENLDKRFRNVDAETGIRRTV